MKKKIIGFVIAVIIVVSASSKGLVLASDGTTVNTSVNGNIVATVINVSVPTSLAFSIDPNKEDATVISDANIVNSTFAPIKVSIGFGSSNFKQSENSEWKPVDFLPSDLDWDNLGKKDTETSLALGVKLKNSSEWREAKFTDTLWVKAHSTSTQDVVFGEIDANSSVSMTLDVYHGNAFSEAKNCSYNIVWSFSLAD